MDADARPCLLYHGPPAACKGGFFLKKNKDGLYRTKIKVGVDADGKIINKYISARTIKELEERKKQVRAYYIDGSQAAHDQLFGAYAVSWFEEKQKKLRETSIEAYRCCLNAYILPRFGDRRIRAIRVSEIEAFLNDLTIGMSKTCSTILSMIFKQAVKDEILQYSPMTVAERPAEPEPDPDAETAREERRGLSDTERAAIIASFNVQDPLSRMIMLAYYLGMRAGEIAALRWGDIDFDQKLVHVSKNFSDRRHTNNGDGKTKTPSGVRDVPLPRQLEAALRPVREAPATRVIKYDSAVKSRLTALIIGCAKELRRLTGIPNISLHWLRHNYVTICWEAGIDIYATARFVGHKNISVTLKIYNHLRNEKEQDYAQKIREMF